MSAFLILAPYGAFATLLVLTSATTSLLSAIGVCLGTILLDAWRGRSLKILATGSAIVFAALALYLTLVDPALSNSKVKLAVDIGIFAISFGSMLIGRPFSMQYALESVHAETAAMPGFMRANYIITGAWSLAALLMMLSNLAILYVPGLPVWLTLGVAFGARNSALFFTRWYRQYRRAKYLKPPADALPKGH
jgi:hypothetical protein